MLNRNENGSHGAYRSQSRSQHSEIGDASPHLQGAAPAADLAPPQSTRSINCNSTTACQMSVGAGLHIEPLVQSHRPVARLRELGWHRSGLGNKPVGLFACLWIDGPLKDGHTAGLLTNSVGEMARLLGLVEDDRAAGTNPGPHTVEGEDNVRLQGHSGHGYAHINNGVTAMR